jgi:conjugative relaxase-like TrwC/TraI family protein
MISAARITRGLVAYLFRKCGKRNYFFDGGEKPGEWILTTTALDLGVYKDVRRIDLYRLTLGFDIHGKKLVKNAGNLQGRNARHMGMTYVFSAPKSWSVAWAFADPDLRKGMEQAFDRAIGRTVREFIEPEIARCRLADGSEVAAKIVAAQFIHVVSREGDMQYHGHVLFPSLGRCPDSQYRALVSKHFYDRKLDAGAFFRVALEHESRHLSLRFHRPLDTKGEQKAHVELIGVPKDICRHFSKRRAQIDDQLDAKGLASAAASFVAALQTRKGKEIVPPRPQLFAGWEQEAMDNDFSLSWRHHLLHPTVLIDQSKEYARAVRKAILECTQQENHFERKDIFRETLVLAQGRGGVDPLRIRTQLDRDLTDSRKFISLGIRNKHQRYTVPEILEVEREFHFYVDTLHESPSFVPLPEKTVQKVLDKERRVHPSQATTPIGKLYDAITGDKSTFSFDAEQQTAIRYATQSAGRLKAICGLAGSTKTTVAAGIADAYQAMGFKTYAVAPSGTAAKNFMESTGVKSDTVQMFLTQAYPTTGHKAKHHLRQLLRVAQGKRTYCYGQHKIDAKTVLFVDEASMVSLRNFTLLAGYCMARGSTVIVLGDDKQLPAIEQGGAFGSILDRIGGFELKNVKRQESEVERERVKQMYHGEMESVLKAYAQEGKVYVTRTHDNAERKLIDRWVAGGGVHVPKDHAIFAATNLEVNRLNDLAQEKRRQAGQFRSLRPLKLHDETFYKGDRVMFTQKNRKYNVENGSTGKLISFHNNPFSAAVTVLFDGERRPREIPLRTLFESHYDGLTRAYAMTVHKMQGRTVDHSYCLLTGAMTDREIGYVALSRHRKSVQIFTDENHAGVALTNLAREAVSEGQKITAKPGLKEEYSPLIQQIKKSHAKTLAIFQQKSAAQGAESPVEQRKQSNDLTIKLKPEN